MTKMTENTPIIDHFVHDNEETPYRSLRLFLLLHLHLLPACARRARAPCRFLRILASSLLLHCKDGVAF
jgi:hypothetical protein